MKNKLRGRILIAAGALLLMAAVSLVLFNRYRDHAAGEHASETLVQVKQYIEKQPPADTSPAQPGDNAPGEASPDEAETEAQEQQELTPLELDGEQYIGMISIPKLGIELPVMRDWTEQNMATAPCRYSGSAVRRDMVICAHNYSSFFKGLDTLMPGDEVIYTLLSGKQYRYEVSWSELINGWDTPQMTDGSENWDLTLFTCTWSGWSRVTVRCNLI